MNMPAAGEIRLQYALSRERFDLEVDATLAMRGITGVFGPSGAGKTSLLRCIAGLDRPASGKLIVDGEIWQDSENNVHRSTHERDIGYVFQEPRLFPHLDVRGNLDYGRKRSGSSDDGSNEIVALLELGSLLGRRTERLSGGEAQRVAIGRALLRSPKLLLMDEPLTALDAERRAEVLPYLERLHEKLTLPIIYVSHNIDEICLLCDQLLVMDNGKSMAQGALQDVLIRTDLPVLGGAEAGSVIIATCRSVDADFGLSEVEVSSGRLWVPGRHEPGASLRLRLRANDISICHERPERTSILNVLPATITRLQPENDASMLVHLQAGDDHVISRITRRSAAHLDLEAGKSLYLQIKSVSVRRA